MSWEKIISTCHWNANMGYDHIQRRTGTQHGEKIDFSYVKENGTWDMSWGKETWDMSDIWDMSWGKELLDMSDIWDISWGKGDLAHVMGKGDFGHVMGKRELGHLLGERDLGHVMCKGDMGHGMQDRRLSTSHG